MKLLKMKLMVAVAAAGILSLFLTACAREASSKGAGANNGSTSSGVGAAPNYRQGSQGQKAVFYFSGIPDQDTSRWAQRYKTMADYLTKKLGVEVKGVPSVDYAAVVTGFAKGDIHLGYFGGLTGVQARLAVPDSEAIAQRPEDEKFHSVFIAQSSLPAKDLQGLKGLTFTFGSESSTSGSLMPRYFLLQAGINPEKDFKGKSNFSGSHDATWKLVETGAFQSGALSEEVWDRAVREKTVDLTKVKEVYRTPAYYDYHWTIRGDVDKTFGPGFNERVKQALLTLDDPKVLELFATTQFIPTKNENYQSILQVAKEVGVIKP